MNRWYLVFHFSYKYIKRSRFGRFFDALFHWSTDTSFTGFFYSPSEEMSVEKAEQDLERELTALLKEEGIEAIDVDVKIVFYARAAAKEEDAEQDNSTKARLVLIKNAQLLKS